MAQRPATSLNPAKIDLLRKALTVAPMTLDLTGLSMFPSIRAGDRCRVVSVDPDSIQVGDIILTTRETRLFAHRVLAIRSGPAKQWIVKGDTLLVPDPPVQAEDILGQVIGLDRRGRFIDLRTPARRRLGAAMARISAPYSTAFVRALLFRRRLLAALAALPAWRARRRARVGVIVVREATVDDIDGLAMLFGEQAALHSPMGGIDMDHVRSQARQMLEGTRKAGAVLWVAVVDDFVSGHAVVGPLGDDGPMAAGWWVMSVYVKMTARGCGLAERMVRAGLEDAAKRGVQEIRYAAFEQNTPSLRLAAKLGFVEDTGSVAQDFASHYTGMGTRGPKLKVTRKEL
ncbi:MAG TPA: GNAT family N-acetyltransferase [Armatimonadota bacterium]|jgi:L-amino acid N-acyltransferase YncA